jgi:ADP-heptose:LPS heptosyltransferase
LGRRAALLYYDCIHEDLQARSIQTPAGAKVLFIELSEMGTAVLADPAMRKARARLGVEPSFLIFKRNADSLEFLRTVSSANTFTIRDDNLFVLTIDSLRFLRWTRQRRIDTTIDLELFSRFTALLSALSGASRRVGFYRFHNEGLSRRIADPSRGLQSTHPHGKKSDWRW